MTTHASAYTPPVPLLMPLPCPCLCLAHALMLFLPAVITDKVVFRLTAVSVYVCVHVCVCVGQVDQMFPQHNVNQLF